MRLVPLMTFRNCITSTQKIGKTAFGERITYLVGEGSFEGVRMRGRILSGGGDWMIVGEDGLSKIDVRKTLETEDGALIHLSYTGLYRFDVALTQKLENGGSADFGETMFQIQAQFETGDSRYQWLNETLALGEGRETVEGVEYRLFSIDQY